jgi:hypothetical protein
LNPRVQLGEEEQEEEEEEEKDWGGEGGEVGCLWIYDSEFLKLIELYARTLLYINIKINFFYLVI